MTSTLQLTAERAPFVMLPRWLLYHRQVGEGAKFLYCVLHDLVAGREGPTRPVTRAELADRCGVSANTIDRRLAELVAVGAVDKEPQILAGGQVGNIYRVWLSPPDQRRATRLPTAGDARPARLPNAGDPPRWAVDNRLLTDGEARSAPMINGGEPPRRWGASLLSGEDPTVLQEQDQELPPQPPRPAGGQGVDGGRAGPRRIPPEPEVRAGTPQPGPPPDATANATSLSAGETPDTPHPNQRFVRGPEASGEHALWERADRSTEGFAQPATTPTAEVGRQGGRRSRAAGTNPRAEAERAEAERIEKEAARRRAELELMTQARRAADRAAEREAEQLEAEAHSISAALDDDALCAVAAQASAGLSGLLAGSTVAVTRAVVGWCRAAAASHPGPFAAAVAAGLAEGLAAGEGSAPLDLPAASAGTRSLRTRVAGILKAGAAV